VDETAAGAAQHVLWRGTLLLDRYDVLRCGLADSPPKGWGPKAVTATLTAAMLRLAPGIPVGWEGMEIPLGLISVVALRAERAGRERGLTLGALINGEIMRLPVSGSGQGLERALALSRIGPRVTSWDRLERAYIGFDDDEDESDIEPVASAAAASSFVAEFGGKFRRIRRQRAVMISAIFAAALTVFLSDILQIRALFWVSLPALIAFFIWPFVLLMVLSRRQRVRRIAEEGALDAETTS
jgi:hypothetical protein